jgi:hypothetical protein
MTNTLTSQNIDFSSWITTSAWKTGSIPVKCWYPPTKLYVPVLNKAPHYEAIWREQRYSWLAASDDVEWSTSWTGHFIPVVMAHWTGSYVMSSACLSALEKRRISWLCQELNPQYIHYTNWANINHHNLQTSCLIHCYNAQIIFPIFSSHYAFLAD